MFELLKPVDLGAAAAVCIAAGMKKIAMSDDEIDPSEIAMIDQFLQEIRAEVEAEGGSIDDIDANDVDLSSLTSNELKETFLVSLAMVSLADGKIRTEEVDLIQEYVNELKYPSSANEIIQNVGKSLLAHFKGVSHFRSHAEEIGEALGLDAATIADILDS